MNTTNPSAIVVTSGSVRASGSRFLILRVLLVLALAACLSAAWCPGARAGRVLVVTDIHFSPYAHPGLVGELAAAPASRWGALFDEAGGGLSGYGEPCNQALLDSLVRAVKDLAPPPEAVLFAGDILAHDFVPDCSDHAAVSDQDACREFVLKTAAYVMGRVAGAFPGVPVYVTPGNNDSFAGDYRLVDQGPFLARAAPLLADACLPRAADRRLFTEMFSVHGSYVLPLQGVPDTDLVALNSVFLSRKHPDTGAAMAELDRLRAALEEARDRGRRVWLLTHIPPGLDVYATLHGPGKASTLLMKSEANLRLAALLDEFADTIALAVAGHTHMDGFRLVPGEGSFREVVHVAPAVTPVFGQNPAFQVLDMGPEGPADLTTWVLDLASSDPAWRPEPSFVSAYGLSPDVGGMAALWGRVLSDPAVRAAWMDRYATGKTPSPMGADWPWYRCAQGAPTADEFDRLCPR